jgi:hypothetical protein
MACVLDRLAVSTRPLKRAQYEAFDFWVTDEGVVVRNGSHANPDEHVYTVTVADGVPTACTCPADEHGDDACKHRLAVAIREPVLDAATVRTDTEQCDGELDDTSAADPDDGGDGDGGDDEDDDPGATPVPLADGTGRAVAVTDTPDEPAAMGRPADCSCPDDPEGFPCWPCVREGRRALPDEDGDTADERAAATEGGE